MYKFTNFCYLMKKRGKKLRKFLKKADFGQICVEFDGCHDNVKSDGHNRHIKISA